jgi:sec-independent protein translocase protein TatA
MIPGIGSLGGTELVIALVMILLIFGAKRLPDLGNSLGIGVKELRKEAAGLGDEEKAERGPRNTDGKGTIAPGAGKGEHSIMRAP